MTLTQRILDSLRDGPGTARELASELDCDYKRMSSMLSSMEARGKLRIWGRVPQGESGPDCKVYEVA